jgi:hypothetical protein
MTMTLDEARMGIERRQAAPPWLFPRQLRQRLFADGERQSGPSPKNVNSTCASLHTELTTCSGSLARGWVTS